METFELRYFLMAAELQSINRAASKLSVSAPAVSKAVKRLEEELGVNLFERVGRNVVLSPYGKQLQRDVSRIVGEIDDIKLKFKPNNYHLGISLVGTEFGLSSFGSQIIDSLDSLQIKYSMIFKMASSSREVERAIVDGEAHFGITTRPPSSGLKKIKIGDYNSKIFLGIKHPLYKYAKNGQKIDIQTVLRHEFASFSGALFGDTDKINQAVDGWRDDKFKRLISLKSDSIEAVLRVIEAGRYLSYLPIPLVKNRDLLPIDISGCPYQCTTEVFLVADNSSEYGWLSSLFDALN